MNRFAIVAGSLFLSSGVSTPSPVPEIAGTWRLVSFESRDDKGRATNQMGADVTGQLIYDTAGNMSVHLMRPGRPPFDSGDRLKGTDEEVRKAFEGYHAYYGHYTVDFAKHVVTHHIVGASFPNLIASEQTRYFELAGRQLKLSTPPIRVGGQLTTTVLVWERL